MEHLVGIFTRVSQVVTDPFAVRESKGEEYLRSNLVETSEFVALHKINGYLDIILINPQKQAQVFRLCHLPESRLKEAKELFNVASENLSILCKCSSECYKTTTLQAICTTLRTRNIWSPAHVAVDAGLTGVYNKSGHLQEWLDSQACENHFTPLHLACHLKLTQVVKDLLKADVSLKKCDDEGNTAIHVTVNNGSLDILELLCDHASTENINILNVAGESALHIACKQNRFEACKILLKHGADPMVPGIIGYPIHYALKYGSQQSLQALLEKYPEQVQQHCQKHGALPLHWCKTPEDVNLLLKFNSPTDEASRQMHHPLHVMVLRSRLEAAVALILGNANVNGRGKNGNTALHLAIIHDYVMLVKMLLLFGADHSLRNDFGETPGLLAVRSNKPNKEAIVEMLSCIGALTLGSPKKVFLSDNTSANNSIPIKQGDRLLCLDGGGVKGLVLTQLLMAIEKVTGKKTKDLFDWIAGTSTGAILAIALAQGRSAVEAQRLYFRLKDKIFSGSRPYKPEPMEEFLKEEFGEDATLSSISDGPHLIITATLADRKPVKLHLFRNYETNVADEQMPHYSKKVSESDLRKLTKTRSTDSSELLWKVARSSGAAPTYFRSMDKFVDGGLLSNNPTLDAITEIHRHHKQQGRKMNLRSVVSLGTGQFPTLLARSVDVIWPTNPVALVNTALAGIELTQMMVDVATETNFHVVDRARAWCETIDANYARLNPCLSEEIYLDEKDDTKLLNIMWETQIYIHNNKDLTASIAETLLGGSKVQFSS
uniref:phospholipase A2 n=1 Tax=Phallusia mammillata TaxID=59560 RepID=A0A6F9DNB6_9ASCI|nr:85/88 kDa calcium-independent phospholipase A2-like [Phallusia mammillata]